MKLATLSIMEEGSITPKISDICERANVSPGTFYVYFDNSADLVHDLLCKWVEAMYSYAPPADGYDDAFDAMMVANRRLIEIYASNPGLFQCLWKHREDNAKFAKIWERNNLYWYRGVKQAILQRSDTSQVNMNAYTLGFFVISSLMDEFLRTLYISRDPGLLEVLQETAMSGDEMAEYLSVVWFRILYGQDPGGSKRKLKFMPNIHPV